MFKPKDKFERYEINSLAKYATIAALKELFGTTKCFVPCMQEAMKQEAEKYAVHQEV